MLGDSFGTTVQSHQKTDMKTHWWTYLGSFVAISAFLFGLLLVSYWGQFFVWTSVTCEFHRRSLDCSTWNSGGLSCGWSHIEDEKISLMSRLL
jgi:hypothetical protein